MEQKTSILKEIKATVMPQTVEGLQVLMDQSGLTIGEVIDRLALHIRPYELAPAVLLAVEQVIFSVSNLPEEQLEDALSEIMVYLAAFVPADRLKDLERKVLESRTEKLEAIKSHIKDLPANDADELTKELALLEKIRLTGD